MSQPTAQKRPRTEAAQLKHLVRVTRSAADAMGNDFFQSLVKRTADAVGADCVYIGEVIRGPVSKMAIVGLCEDGALVDGREQELPGTASAQVVAEGSFVCARDAAELFPMDPGLKRLAGQAFVGYRLASSSGQAMGVLAAIFRQAPQDLDLANSVLQTFAPRAAAELERKQDHERLRRSDERYRAFIASSAEAMWRIELEKPIPISLSPEEQIDRIFRDGYLAECNEAFARLFNARSAEEVIGTRFAALFSRDDQQLLEQMRLSIRSGYRGVAVENAPLNASGRRVYRLRNEFGIVEHGELQRIWGTTRDITDLRRAELALDASERKCHEMLERLQLPAVVADTDGKILFANDTLLRLGSWSKQDIAEMNWFQMFAGPEDRDYWKAALRHTDSDPTFTHFECQMMTADNTPRLVSWDTTLLLNEDDQVQGIAAIGADVTSRRAIEAQIHQAQKLEGIGRMAAGIGHDFNNLLTVIIGHTSKLVHETRESLCLQESLSAISAAAEQCAGLSQQLLAVGRQQRLQSSICSLNAIIVGAESVLQELAGRKTELGLQLDPRLKPINADPAQIQRVLANLAGNACCAMPNGGQLRIVTANADLDEAAVSAMPGLKPGSYVRLTVTDTGTGMSEDVKARIFDPYFTTKPPGKGTGLGLSTVYGIVGQSGGHISVRSRLGEGASFTILLPAVDP